LRSPLHGRPTCIPSLAARPATLPCQPPTSRSPPAARCAAGGRAWRISMAAPWPCTTRTTPPPRATPLPSCPPPSPSLRRGCSRWGSGRPASQGRRAAMRARPGQAQPLRGSQALVRGPPACAPGGAAPHPPSPPPPHPAPPSSQPPALHHPRACVQARRQGVAVQRERQPLAHRGPGYHEVRRGRCGEAALGARTMRPSPRGCLVACVAAVCSGLPPSDEQRAWLGSAQRAQLRPLAPCGHVAPAPNNACALLPPRPPPPPFSCRRCAVRAAAWRSCSTSCSTARAGPPWCRTPRRSTSCCPRWPAR
jgi:hypothetical protein